jgi:tetratricopeptide (TPR) repeat protein
MNVRAAVLFFIIIVIAAPLCAQEPPEQLDAIQNYNAGRDLEYRNRREEADRYYNEAIRLSNEELTRNPSNMEAFVTLTWTLQRQRKYSEVISWGERALRISAADYRIVEIMGEAYFYLDRYADSLRSMQRYTNALPHGSRASVAYFFIGEIFRLQQQYRHADIAYTTAVRLEPNSALWWYRLGSVREAAGDPAPAGEAYARALKLNPSYQEAAEGLARVQNSG